LYALFTVQCLILVYVIVTWTTACKHSFLPGSFCYVLSLL